MPSEFPMNDPRNIWQKQPTESFKMSADQLRRKAQQRQRRTRFAVLREAILGLILFVFFARFLAGAREVVGVGHPLSLWITRMGLGLLSLWCIGAPFLMYK